MEHMVAFMVGVTALVMGLSLVLRCSDWLDYTRQVGARGRSVGLILGYMHLIIGTFIVGFHWKWEGLPLVTTLIGVGAIAEGVVYSIFPDVVPALLRWYSRGTRLTIILIGLLSMAVGVVALCEWKQVMYPQVFIEE